MGGITCLLLLLWAGVTVSTGLDLQKRIIGGQKCGGSERLYHVMLKSNNRTHQSSCGGSLISAQWILTAAHCWMPGWTMEAYLGVHPGNNRQPVQTITRHVIYRDANGDHDIMLLKLPTHNTNIQPVPLPVCGTHPPLGATVQIAGHADTTGRPGDLHIDGFTPDLHCADIRVTNCPLIINLIFQHKFCGNTRYGVTTCPGDSGGGVVYNGRIYGVIHGAMNGTYVCGGENIFMDVCKYMNWINRIITTP